MKSVKFKADHFDRYILPSAYHPQPFHFILFFSFISYAATQNRNSKQSIRMDLEKINGFLRLIPLFHIRHFYSHWPHFTITADRRFFHLFRFAGIGKWMYTYIVSEWVCVWIEKGTTVRFGFETVYLSSSESTWNFDVGGFKGKQLQKLKVKSHMILVSIFGF